MERSRNRGSERLQEGKNQGTMAEAGQEVLGVRKVGTSVT